MPFHQLRHFGHWPLALILDIGWVDLNLVSHMIRHIVFFSAKDPKDREVIFDGLSLLVDIPHLAHFEIGRNEGLDKISVGGPDFVVYAEFKDAKALAAYKEHPLYEQSISIVRPLRDMRIAADFEVADTARSSS